MTATWIASRSPTRHRSARRRGRGRGVRRPELPAGPARARPAYLGDPTDPATAATVALGRRRPGQRGRRAGDRRGRPRATTSMTRSRRSSPRPTAHGADVLFRPARRQPARATRRATSTSASRTASRSPACAGAWPDRASCLTPALPGRTTTRTPTSSPSPVSRWCGRASSCSASRVRTRRTRSRPPDAAATVPGLGSRRLLPGVPAARPGRRRPSGTSRRRPPSGSELPPVNVATSMVGPLAERRSAAADADRRRPRARRRRVRQQPLPVRRRHPPVGRSSRSTGYAGDEHPPRRGRRLRARLPACRAHPQGQSRGTAPPTSARRPTRCMRLMLRRGIPFGEPIAGVDRPGARAGGRRARPDVRRLHELDRGPVRVRHPPVGNSTVQPNVGGHDPIIGQRDRYGEPCARSSTSRRPTAAASVEMPRRLRRRRPAAATSSRRPSAPSAVYWRSGVHAHVRMARRSDDDRVRPRSGVVVQSRRLRLPRPHRDGVPLHRHPQPVHLHVRRPDGRGGRRVRGDRRVRPVRVSAPSSGRAGRCSHAVKNAGEVGAGVLARPARRTARSSPSRGGAAPSSRAAARRSARRRSGARSACSTSAPRL